MSDMHFVRSEMLPERAPPASTVGVIGWMRENLFSGVVNSILTVLSVAFVIWALIGVLGWAVAPTWEATNLRDCQDILAGHHGACWGVVNDRWQQLLFGFYPKDLYWRPILAFVLLFIAMIPVLFNMITRRMNWVLLLATLGVAVATRGGMVALVIGLVLLAGAALIAVQLFATRGDDRAEQIAAGAKRLPNPLIFTMLFPFIAPWLLWGGDIWLPLLVLGGFVLGWLVYRLLTPVLGSLAGLILSVAITIVWWLFFVGMVGSGISQSIGASRMEAVAPKLEAQIATLEAEVTALKEARAPLDPKSPEARALVREISTVEGVMKRRSELLSRVKALPTLEAKLDDQRRKAEAARAALPPALAELEALDDLPKGTSDEERDALKAALNLEHQVKLSELSVAMIYERVGLVGLEPVDSRDFGGMMLSLTIGVVAIGCSLPIGIVLALGRQSDLMIVKSLCVGFIEFIRGVPLITLLFVASTLLNIFMPKGTDFDIILRVIIMATLFASAYMAEVIRGGLAALPRGQYEAADALGLDYWKAQRLIIMPQALKISIPGIVSTFIGLFKDTTLVSIIGLMDPLGLSNTIRAHTDWVGIYWELFVVIALMFFLFCFSMSRYSMYLERRLRTDHR